MKIVKTTTPSTPYGTSQENYEMSGTMIDLHILVSAMQAYCHGGYKGENMNHLSAAEKVYDVLLEAWCSDVDGTFEAKK